MPIIATAVGGIPEMVTHEKDALLTAPAAAGLAGAVTRLLKDPGLGSALSESAGKRLAAHSPGAYFENVSTILRELVGADK